MKEFYYKIGEVAEILQVEQYTLRYLENSLKLKIKRNERGDRLYTESDLDTLKLILKLKNEKGLNTTAIRMALDNMEEQQETSLSPIEKNYPPEVLEIKSLAQKITEQNETLLERNEKLEQRLKNLEEKLDKYNKKKEEQIDQLIDLWKSERESRSKSWLDRLRGK